MLDTCALFLAGACFATSHAASLTAPLACTAGTWSVRQHGPTLGSAVMQCGKGKDRLEGQRHPGGRAWTAPPVRHTGCCRMPWRSNLSHMAGCSSMTPSKPFGHVLYPCVAAFGKPLIRLVQHILPTQLLATHLGQL